MAKISIEGLEFDSAYVDRLLAGLANHFLPKEDEFTPKQVDAIKNLNIANWMAGVEDAIAAIKAKGEV